MTLQPKPRFASPCNHCGECCKSQLCELAQIALPGGSAPCPGLITETAAGMERMLAESLGIGCGCSMQHAGTTDAEVDEFDRVSFKKIYGRAREAA